MNFFVALPWSLCGIGLALLVGLMSIGYGLNQVAQAVWQIGAAMRATNTFTRHVFYLQRRELQEQLAKIKARPTAEANHESRPSFSALRGKEEPCTPD